MIARLIQRFIAEEYAWDCHVDALAGLPENF